MITLEQAKRLKEAGWEKAKSYFVDMSAWGRSSAELMSAEDANYRSNETKNISFTDIDTTIPAPDEKEMMEFLKECLELEWFPQTGKWHLNYTDHVTGGEEMASDADLTEALVQACVKVLEQGKEGGGR